MAYTVDIMNKNSTGNTNSLLAKVEINGTRYEFKDLVARANIGTLSQGLDAIVADLENYVKDTGIFDSDKEIKAYIDSQVGAINKFDIAVVEELPAPSAETMYILYLKRVAGSTGEFVEYITVDKGEGAEPRYVMEQIGSTAMDLTGFVTEEELAEELKDYQTVAAHNTFANGIETLGSLADQDSATGTVPGQTISGVKATGTTAGSIAVALEATEKEVASTGKYTPAGTVSGTATTAGSIEVTLNHEGVAATLSKGDYTPAGTVSADFSHASADAELVKGTHTPEGSVSVALSGATFNAITGVGTQASFQEGAFTPAELKYEAVSEAYATEGLTGTVNEDEECLILGQAEVKGFDASCVTSFTGGSKAADTFTANSLPTMVSNTVGVQSATFTGTAHETITGVKYDKAALNGITFAGTKAEGALVTGVTYDKAAIGTQKFTGETVDIAATFAGTEGDINVAGKANDYAVKTAEFTGAAVELAVGDIVVAAKDVTVQ